MLKADPNLCHPGTLARVPPIANGFLPFDFGQAFGMLYTFAMQDRSLPPQPLMTSIIQNDRIVQKDAIALAMECGLYEIVEDFNSRRGRDAGGVLADWADLMTLWQDVQRRRPRGILEMGSGLSTAVLAEAAGMIGATLVTVDPEDHWRAMTWQGLSDEHKRACSMIDPIVEPVTIFDIETVRFAGLPSEGIDYIYLDGAPAGSVLLGAETVLGLPLSEKTQIRIDARMQAVFAFHSSTVPFKVWSQGILFGNKDGLGPAFGTDQFFTTLIEL